MPTHAAPLLDSVRYRRFLATAHPHLSLSDERLGPPASAGAARALPSYVSALDVREPMTPGPFRELLGVTSRLAPTPLRPQSLFIGTPFERYDQTHLLDDVEDPFALAARARDSAADEALELVVVTCVSPNHPRLSSWLEAGFVALPSFPDSVVALAGSSLDEHLRSLPPRDRSGIRRNRRRFEQAGHSLERLRASHEVADALYESYRPFYERATVKWLPHTRRYFADVASLDERVRLTVARDERGEVGGFVLSFEDGVDARGRRIVHAGRIGVAQRLYKKDAVYFRLLYHVLEDALALGATHVSLEPTAYRTKRHLGARRRRMVNLVLGVSAPWRLLLATCAGLGQRMLRHLDDRRMLERVY